MKDYIKLVSFWQFIAHNSTTAVIAKSVNTYMSFLSAIFFTFNLPLTELIGCRHPINVDCWLIDNCNAIFVNHQLKADITGS